jgi:hypothetical protein
MMSSSSDIGGGWFHVELRESGLTSLPGTPDDPPGMNLHLGTDTGSPGTMYVDNLTGEQLETRVPMVSSWGMGILVTLLVATGILVLRRR